ncbi:unnamed protein product [Prunus brigantina]
MLDNRLSRHSRGLIWSTAQNGELPIGKGDKLNKYQSPKIDQEGKEQRTNHMLHFWDVNVMYAQVCVLNRVAAKKQVQMLIYGVGFVQGRGGCDFWVWYNVEMCERSKVVISGLLKSQDKLENSLAKARRREKILWAALVVSWMLIAMSFFGRNDGSDGLKLKTLELA